MLKVFHRACARADIEVQHSQGFNPHPKLSLPLPRPVGVESDDELLCVQMHICDAWCGVRSAETIPEETKSILESQNPRNTQYAIRNTIKSRLSEQLPKGCELLSVGCAKSDESIQPSSVVYIIPVQQDSLSDEIKEKIGRFMANKSIIIERRIDSIKSKIKMLDVRPFIKSIDLKDSEVVVECNVSPAGSIRVEEILKLLEIEVGNLAAPIRRTNVQWQKTEDRIQKTE
jgi:uncharacterized protein (DUF2344 family)